MQKQKEKMKQYLRNKWVEKQVNKIAIKLLIIKNNSFRIPNLQSALSCLVFSFSAFFAHNAINVTIKEASENNALRFLNESNNNKGNAMRHLILKIKSYFASAGIIDVLSLVTLM